VLRRRRALVFVVLVVVVAAIGGVTAVVVNHASNATTDSTTASIVHGALEVGKAAPTFDVPGLDGGRVKVGASLDHPMIVTFFASWCHPCERETPILRRGHTKYEPRGVEIIGITYQDAPNDSRAFAKRLGIAWPLGIDESGAVARAYGVRAIPLTFFIRADGTVASRVFGLHSSNELDRNVALIMPR
jgi:cytochrome c biogenesis protein CcmG/thiol:disulfide interchange protein DsbE